MPPGWARLEYRSTVLYPTLLCMLLMKCFTHTPVQIYPQYNCEFTQIGFSLLRARTAHISSTCSRGRPAYLGPFSITLSFISLADRMLTAGSIIHKLVSHNLLRSWRSPTKDSHPCMQSARAFLLFQQTNMSPHAETRWCKTPRRRWRLLLGLTKESV